MLDLSNDDWDLRVYRDLTGRYAYTNKTAEIPIEGTLLFEQDADDGHLILVSFTGTSVLPYYVRQKLLTNGVVIRCAS